MTVSRDLKALIHERMQKTGESYVPARRNVLAQRHTPSLQIVESTDETDSIRATPAWDPVVVRRFRTPEEAKAARPAISDMAVLPVAQFVDITGKCEFPPNHHVTCQLETDSGICDHEFGDGYVMRRSDGVELFVGGVCAKKQFQEHVKFARETARAQREVTTGDYVAKLQDLLSDPQLDQRLNDVETRRRELLERVDVVRRHFADTVLDKINRLAKGTNSTITLLFERIEKEEDRNGNVRLVSKWIPSVVARIAAPKALVLNRFNKVAEGLHKASQARRVAEASTAHSLKTLRSWCAGLERLRDCESALDAIEKDLGTFTQESNLAGLVWLCETLPQRVATTKSILWTLGHPTVTNETARAVYGRWETQLRAAHGNRNFRIP